MIKNILGTILALFAILFIVFLMALLGNVGIIVLLLIIAVITLIYIAIKISSKNDKNEDIDEEELKQKLALHKAKMPKLSEDKKTIEDSAKTRKVIKY